MSMTNLRVGLGDYESYRHYSRGTNPFRESLSPNFHVKRDDLIDQYPYPIRMAEKQGFFLFLTTGVNDPKISNAIKEKANLCKKERQAVMLSSRKDLIELGFLVFHIFENEIVVGCIKTPGYLKGRLGTPQLKEIYSSLWDELIRLYPKHVITVPTFEYLNHLSLAINNSKIPRLPYKGVNMRAKGFKKVNELFWQRDCLKI